MELDKNEDDYYEDRYRLISLKLLMKTQSKKIYKSQKDIIEDEILQMQLTKIIDYEYKTNDYYKYLVSNLTLENYESIFQYDILNDIDLHIHCLVIIYVISNEYCHSFVPTDFYKIREKIICEINSKRYLESIIDTNDFRLQISEKYNQIINIENNKDEMENSLITHGFVIFFSILTVKLTVELISIILL